MDIDYIFMESITLIENENTPQPAAWLDQKTGLGVSRAVLFLVLVVALAAGLLFGNLGAIGFGNHYYTAAVKAMLQSWHNFFFVAAEPGGSVSVDKPPVGLWLEAASAAIFGVTGFAVVLPEILAGLASIVVLFHLVRRKFGSAAGLIAALALAITPVVVATNRNNTIDSTLIFTLLLAAWAFVKATETGRFKYLLLGALLVGIGFNIKMLEAYLPLPAFYAMYFLGSPEKIWRKIGRLALASILLMVVSFSWAVAVDLTPANQRPYVGSSGNNSEMSLIFGYNGVERLLGMFGRRSGPGGFPQVGNRNFGQGFGGNNRRFVPGNPPLGLPGPSFQGGPTGGFNRGGFGGGGFMGTGQAGPLRLFQAPLSKEASWLLLFGLLGGAVLAARSRLRWPLSEQHQAVVLWGGWLVTAGVFFSVAGFFHEYYLSTLAPPLAALVGIGAVQLWQLRIQHPWLGFGLIALGAAGTLAFQFQTALAFVDTFWWLPLAIGLLGFGSILLLASTFKRFPKIGMAGFSLVLVALLITPGVWSVMTMQYATANQSLPSAYSGRVEGPANRGGLQVNQQLLSFLEKNTQGMKYLMAVPSSMQGADYVLATGRPVLYLGGFMGQDQVLNPQELTQLVDTGQLRYIYWNARGFGGIGFRAGGMGEQSNVTAWVQSQCKVVQGFDTTTRNAGAPDGTGDRSAAPTFQGGPEILVTLYDCGL